MSHNLFIIVGRHTDISAQKYRFRGWMIVLFAAGGWFVAYKIFRMVAG
jgi:hypothetical protein